MTLETIYLNDDPRVDTWRVVIGGVNVPAVKSVSYSFAHSKVPSFFITLRAAQLPATAVFDAAVTVEKGFNGITTRVFTGTVLNVNGDERSKTIECQGMSSELDNNYHKVVVSTDGIKTISDLIEDLFVAAGIVHYHVDLPAWTPGTVAPQTVEFATYGEAINKLAEIEGGRWYELPDGTVRVDVRDPIPSHTSWRTYFSGVLTGVVEGYPAGIVSGRPRLRRINYTQQARDVKNQCWVRGAVVTSTNPDGTQDSITIEEHAYAASPWVTYPSGAQAYNDELFPNQFIDTAVKAGTTAARRVGITNRLMTQVGAEIDGDPQAKLGVTVGIEDPNYSGTTGRWFVEAYKSDWAAGKFITTLTAIGGPQAGGTINVVPFAFFTHAVEREVMGDREWCLLGLDGSGSLDPDGTIVSWLWSDNLALIAGTDAVITRRIDAALISSPWEITLTVTDNLGATNSLTLTIQFAASSSEVWIPALFLAFDADASATADGGINWQDEVLANCISTAAKPADGFTFGYGVFGTGAGEIYRTTDYCITAPALVMAACGSAITHLWWDVWVTNRVWAVTQNGRVYSSVDDGATWALYDDLATKLGLPNLTLNSRIGTPGAGGVWVFGGTGDGYPFYAWDAFCDHNWTQGVIGGELEADLVTSGHPADVRIADSSAPTAGLAIILNSATHTPAVYYSPSGGIDGSDWKRAIGDAGALAKSRGMWIWGENATDYVLGFNDNLTYRMDVAAGVGTISVAPATLDAGDIGNYIMGLSWWTAIAKTYLLAAERTSGAAFDGTVYKTWDRFDTVDKARPATGFTPSPAGAKGMMLAIGAPNTVVTAPLYLHESPATNGNYARHVAKWANVGWVLTSDPAPAVQNPVYYFKKLGSNLYRIVASTGVGQTCYQPRPGQLQRSPDEGVTWVDVGPAPVTSGGHWWGVNHVSRASDGTLWLCCCSSSTNCVTLPANAIYKSTDDGLTWGSPVYTDGTIEYGVNCRSFLEIYAHPNNPSIVVCLASGFGGVCYTCVTLDGGTVWTQHWGSMGNNVMRDRHLAFLDSGRLVQTTYSAAGYSDDYGDTNWTWATVGPAGTNWCLDLVVQDSILFCAVDCGSGCTRISRSLDGAAHWETIAEDFTVGNGANTDKYAGLTYDMPIDTLYFASDVAATDGVHTFMVLAIQQATGLGVGPVVDLTANLATLFSGHVGPICLTK